MASGKNEMEQSSQPPIPYKWLVDLDSTLSSSEGTKALESYLLHSGTFSLLEFIWACDGLQNLAEETPNKADELVSCIYKNYIINGCLPILSDQVVISIAQHLEAHFEQPEPSESSSISGKQNFQPSQLNLLIFENAKIEVDNYLRTQIFPQFQKAVKSGDVYVGRSCEVTDTPVQHAGSLQASSKITKEREDFMRKLCEKLEGLKQTREDDSKPS